MEDRLYRNLVESYPPVELMRKYDRPGQVFYYLNEHKTGEQYHSWIADHPAWRNFHRWVKSEAFLRSTMEMLLERHIDLGYFRPRPGALRRIRSVLGSLKRGRIPAVYGSLYARFEFVALSGEGGAVLPHTDAPSKLVTIVLSMTQDGQWDASYGGGLDVNVKKNPTKSYGNLNPKIEFDEVDTIRTFEYVPNQEVVFVKTHNSWHSVRPLAGPPDAFRRTVGINIMTETPIL